MDDPPHDPHFVGVSCFETAWFDEKWLFLNIKYSVFYVFFLCRICFCKTAWYAIEQCYNIKLMYMKINVFFIEHVDQEMVSSICLVCFKKNVKILFCFKCHFVCF